LEYPDQPVTIFDMLDDYCTMGSAYIGNVQRTVNWVMKAAIVLALEFHMGDAALALTLAF
jgi:hypothetical protein